MIVKALIEALNKLDPEADVVIVYDSETCYTDAVRVEFSELGAEIIGGVEEVSDDH